VENYLGAEDAVEGKDWRGRGDEHGYLVSYISMIYLLIWAHLN
jgi:hypothetical protein